MCQTALTVLAVLVRIDQILINSKRKNCIQNYQTPAPIFETVLTKPRRLKSALRNQGKPLATSSDDAKGGLLTIEVLCRSAS